MTYRSGSWQRWKLHNDLQDGKGKVSPFLLSPKRYQRHIRKAAHGCQAKKSWDEMSSQCPWSSLSLKRPWPDYLSVRESTWVKSVLFQFPLLIVESHTELWATRALQKPQLISGCAQIRGYPNDMNEGQKLLRSVICTWVFLSYNVSFVNTSVNILAAFWVKLKLSESITLSGGWYCSSSCEAAVQNPG